MPTNAAVAAPAIMQTVFCSAFGKNRLQKAASRVAFSEAFFYIKHCTAAPLSSALFAIAQRKHYLTEFDAHSDQCRKPHVEYRACSTYRNRACNARDIRRSDRPAECGRKCLKRRHSRSIAFLFAAHIFRCTPLPEAERRFNCTSKMRKLKEIYAHAQKQTRAQHQYCKKRRKSVHAAFYAT